MPSTYTTNLGIELPADGEKDAVWGQIVNDNMSIVDRATNGVVTVALSGTTHTLTTSDGVASDGQYHTVIFGGSPSGTNTVTLAPNDAQKAYHIVNASGQSVIITQGSGTTVTIPNGTNAVVYADGAGATAAVSSFTSGISIATTNIAGLTSSVAELNILDGATLSTAELNHLNGSSANLATFTLPASTTISTFGATLVDDADATAARATLGITGSAYDPAAVAITGGSITGITDLAVADGGTGASTAADARTNLGLVIGTNVQAFDAGLQSISGLTTAADRMIYTTASDTYAVATLTSAGRALLDDADAAAQLTTLGGAPLASPTFTGVPAAPTATPGTNTTQVATTAFVEAATGSLSSGALAFLATANASNDATIDFTAFDGSAYDAYLFVLSNVVPATDSVSFYLRTSTNGGSTYDSGATDYRYALVGGNTGTGSGNIDSPGASQILLVGINVGSAGGEDGFSGEVKVLGPHISSDRTKVTILGGATSTSSELVGVAGAGERLSAANVDAVRFLFSSGNIESGTITMYGYRNA